MTHLGERGGLRAARCGLCGFLSDAFQKGDQRCGDEIFLEKGFAAFAVLCFADDFHESRCFDGEMNLLHTDISVTEHRFIPDLFLFRIIHVHLRGLSRLFGGNAGGRSMA